MLLAPSACTLQNHRPAPAIGASPFHNFLQGTKATQADILAVEAAIADAGRIDGGEGIVHEMLWEFAGLNHRALPESSAAVQIS